VKRAADRGRGKQGERLTKGNGAKKKKELD